MILEKPWKPEAVVRLFLGVLICIYGGSLAGCVLHYWQAGGKAGARVFYPLAGAAFASLSVALFRLRRPMPLERMLPRLMTTLGFCYGGFLLGIGVEKYGAAEDPSIGQMVAAILCSHGAGLLLVGRFVQEHESSWIEAFGLNHRWRRAVGAGLVAAAFFLPLGLGMQQVSAWVLNQLPSVMKPEEQRAVQVLRSAVSWGGRGMLGVITILLVPVAEEVFFRGILYTVVKQAGFQRLALWGTAGFFALIHFNLMTFLPLMALALVLTFLYERTENLLAPIAAHSLFNALNFSLVCFSSGT